MLQHYTMKEYNGVQVKLHTYFIATLYGGQWSASYSSHFPLGNKPLIPIT